MINLFFSLAFAFVNFTSQEDVYVEFTNQTTFDELITIRAQLVEKGVSLEYQMIEFDSTKKLKALSIDAKCDDGFSGTAHSTELLNGGKITFSRNSKTGEGGFTVERPGK
ncbi:MAG: hypothetical protein ABIQ02_08900 [Saprospiraceae bacterium]